MSLKEKPIVFFKAKNIDVSISWSELFVGHVRINVTAHEAKLLYSQYVLKKLSQNSRENIESAKDIKETLFPVSLEEIRIVDSEITSSDFFGVTDKLPTQLASINGRVTNLTPTEEKQISHFQVSGKFPKDSPLEVEGLYNNYHESLDWKAKLKVERFDLVSTNDWIYAMIPLSFESGAVSIFAEAESKNKKVKGYAKPFVKHAHILGDDKDFKELKQFGVEISASVVNHLFRTRKDKTVATILNFSYEDNKFDWDFWKVLKELVKNGYVEELKEGFEKSPVI